MKLQSLLFLTACAATAGLPAVRLVAAEPATDPRLDKVFADWKNRRERIKTIRYRASGDVTLPKGSFTDDITGAPLGPNSPPHDISWPKKMTLLLDFTTNRHRVEVENQGYSKSEARILPPVRTTTVFDSKELWSQYVRPPGTKADKRDADINVASGNMRGLAFPSGFWPFFLGHGVAALFTQQHILPGQLSNAPKTDVYHVAGEGNIADRACLVLRTQAQDFGNATWDELWVDPGRESAVLRQASYASGTIVTDIRIDYQNTSAGWLPQGWVITNGPGDRAYLLERMWVDEVQIDPVVSDADFRVDVKPGMTVQRTSYAGSPDQILAPQPNMNDPLMRVGQDGSLYPINGPEPRSPWPFVWGVGGLALLLAGIGFLLWRRRRPKPAP